MLCRNVIRHRVVLRLSSTSANFTPKQIETVPSAVHSYLFASQAPSTAASKQLALDLPPLLGKDIEEHFRSVGSNETNGYRRLLERAEESFAYTCNNIQEAKKDKAWTEHLTPAAATSVTPFPLSKIKWEMQAGWTRYSHEDGSSRQVPYPEEDMFCFDVEVCVKEGHLPVLAVALSDKAWYGWCSDRLVNGTAVPQFIQEEHLIPLGGKDTDRMVIGHNVGYDRARAREPYCKTEAKVRFMDTMSMFLSMFGMADHQTNQFGLNDNDIYNKETKKEKMGWYDTWKARVSKNSLFEATRFLTGISLNKQMQDFFVKEGIEDVRTEFQDLIRYCAEDTLASAMIFSKMWPEFRRRFPDDITLFGMIQMGNAYLPINRNWRLFYEQNMAIAKEKEDNAAKALSNAARDVVEELKAKGGAKEDLWMWAYDSNNNGLAKSSRKKQSEYPDWYFKLFKKKSGALISPDDIRGEDMVIGSALVPAVFGLIYGPYPVHKDSGWGYLTPVNKKRKAKLTHKHGLGINVELLRKSVDEFSLDFGEIELPEEATVRYADCDFYKFPHQKGSGNVGDVLAKQFWKQIEAKVLRATRNEKLFLELFDCQRYIGFWNNYKKRYEEEVTTWYDSSADPAMGAIAPAISPAGTISRRSVHKLWVTLTNLTDEGKLGAGIKTMVQAPPGMRFVGADVDSQEQWLAGVFGDGSVAKILPESERICGLTPCSNMMLAGSKSDGSDLHSVVARQLKINRDKAKVLNYARLYGSGERHAVKELKGAGMKETDAVDVAAELFSLTKGIIVECRQLKPEFVPLFREFEGLFGEKLSVVVQGELFIPSYRSLYRRHTADFEKWVMQRLSEEGIDTAGEEEVVALLYEHATDKKDLYYGGYESATFNFLEQEAKRHDLRTPVLNCQLCNALAPLPEGTPDAHDYANRFKRSVTNWIVQSSAVDFLHLLLVSMTWLCKKYDINARFVISIHDEVRYLCTEEEAPRVALALMLSHLYVRTFIAHRVGFRELPMSVAFFSQVDCDTVLRKEVDAPCHNPDGSIVPNGTAWNIDDLIKITGGSLRKL